jgi:glutaredoxin-like protein
VPTSDEPSTHDSAPDASGEPDESGVVSPVTVYWRPACGFCSSLMRSLDRVGLAHARRNIWEDEDAAAFVRSVTRGSETVPTVAVGDRALVNPTRDDVLAAVAELAPDHLPDDWQPREPGGLGRTVTRLFGG